MFGWILKLFFEVPRGKEKSLYGQMCVLKASWYGPFGKCGLKVDGNMLNVFESSQIKQMLTEAG